MIEFEGVAKRLGNRQVVDGVSLRALPGEVTALVGPHGAGKSMLLRCLSGLVLPTAGTIRVAGVPIEGLAIPGRMVGIAMDVNCLHPSRTGRETLRLALMANRMPLSRADALLAEVGVTRPEQRVRRYDRDQAQRLAMAVALAGQPSALVLDEPLVALDESSREWFGAQVAGFARRGGTVLLTASTREELDGIATRFIEMDQGRIAEAEVEAETAPEATAVRRQTVIDRILSRQDQLAVAR